ncbi:MAG: NADH-quinone oxidoreductase subunit M [Actinomycetota bacterium]|nr:NADH-quinone oxidoreductase subunit M [Actinomycetota bacterium]
MSLSILTWLPLVIALVGVLFPPRLGSRVVFAGSLVTLAVAISFLARFDAGHSGLQFVTDTVWISSLGIHYKLGLDGLNVALVLLTTVIFSAALLWAALREWDRSRVFFFHFGLAQSAVLGAFCAQDLALFVAFFDLMLIPFYFLTGIWGSTGPGAPDRVRATTKLVVYTLVGSFLMLVAAIATGALASSQHHTALTFVISSLRGLPLSHTSQDWIFLGFAAAFVVKMPLIPLHGWLPDGYKAMPIPAVAVFSAVVSKVAAYGFLRIVLPLFPYASAHFQTLMLVIALLSVLWATLVAMTTPDARLVVAYSSVAQLGFITLGIFSLQPQGVQGALLQMLNHALVTAPLFFIVAALAARTGGSEKLADMGGVAFRAPVLASLFLIVSLATLAIPGSANFAGEFLILLGLFKAKLAMAVIASLGVVGAAVYALRLFIGAMHNRVGLGAVREWDLGRAEAVVIAPFVAVILALAFYPQFGLTRSEHSVRPAVAAAEIQQGQNLYGPRRVAQTP